MKNTECLIIKSCVIGELVGVSLDHSVSLTKSHIEAIIGVPQIITFAVVEKGMEHKGEQK